MRAFLSINLDRSVREGIARLQGELGRQTRGIRWVKPDLLHLTLIFLGDIQGGDSRAFAQPLRELAQETAAFRFTLDRLGAFPGIHSPRVIWLGMQSGAEQLIALAKRIEDVLGTFGHFSTGPFVPHLTIGRRKRGADLFSPGEIFKEPLDSPYTVYADRFFLMQSILYPTGPLYTPVKEFLLEASL